MNTRSRRILLEAMLALLAASMGSGCGEKKNSRPPPRAPLAGSFETGIASWYGDPYHGRRAANGEIYDMDQLTAAHRTLPFGTRVRVKNLDNGSEVEVRITDRGPFIGGRIIDLSRAAARSIRMIGPGTARVRLEILDVPAAGLYLVQAGAFQNRGNAEQLRRALARQHHDARIEQRDDNPRTWIVIVGAPQPQQEAARLAQQLRGAGHAAMVIRAPSRE